MATEPLPFIKEDDYEAIQKIIPGLPDTYAEWLKMHEGEKRERSKINPIQEVPVRPDEFEAYCKARGGRRSTQDLLRFALDNAGPHEVDHEFDPLENDLN